jgi:small subunit ribosomal protein S5
MKGNKNISDESIVEDIVDVSRVTKVVKGGRRFSFSVCLIAGNQDGMVGYGHGKAKEVPEAKIKASQDARKSLIKIPLYQGRTIHHDVVGRSGSGHVLLRRAMPGTGIIAGGPMRKILECLGIKDIVAKSLGSSNTYNMIAATFDALQNLNSPKMIAEKRGIKPTEVSANAKPKKAE